MKEKILEEYDSMNVLYRDFGDRVVSYLQDVVNPKIVMHSLVSRLKSRESLSKKIDKKDNKYKSLSEITDISGIRIITFLDSDVVEIGKHIEEHFNLDLPNCSNKRDQDFDRFGYRSLHYVLGFKNENLQLPGLQRFEGLKAEVQVRSILQHAWAELEHDLGYKSEIEIPKPLKRGFTRLSALLETADIEFDRLKTQIQNYSASVSNSIKDEPEIVSFDKDSLSNFVLSDRTMLKIQHMFQVAEFKFDENRNDAQLVLVKMQYFDMKNLKDLQRYLSMYEEHFERFMKYLIHTYSNPKPVISNFTALLFFLHFMAGSGSREYLEKYCIFGSNLNETYRLTVGGAISKAYNETRLA